MFLLNSSDIRSHLKVPVESRLSSSATNFWPKSAFTFVKHDYSFVAIFSAILWMSVKVTCNLSFASAGNKELLLSNNWWSKSCTAGSLQAWRDFPLYDWRIFHCVRQTIMPLEKSIKLSIYWFINRIHYRS